MFDAENHVIDPSSGFAKHNDTGHLLGIEQRPPVATSGDPEWPRWVTPHESHVIRQKVEGFPDHVSTPSFAQNHVNRVDGAVTVLVANEEEEKLATSEYQEKKVEPSVEQEDAARLEAEENERLAAKTAAAQNDERIDF